MWNDNKQGVYSFFNYWSVKKEKEKFGIIETQNEDLRKQVKKLKTKNTFIVIIGGALLTALTVLSVLK